MRKKGAKHAVMPSLTNERDVRTLRVPRCGLVDGGLRVATWVSKFEMDANVCDGPCYAN